jgi:hypothetical protein
MKPDVKNKLILQLLPAVASRNAGTKPSSADELRQFWNDCLAEADSLSELYEKHITTEKDAE